MSFDVVITPYSCRLVVQCHYVDFGLYQLTLACVTVGLMLDVMSEEFDMILTVCHILFTSRFGGTSCTQEAEEEDTIWNGCYSLFPFCSLCTAIVAVRASG